MPLPTQTRPLRPPAENVFTDIAKVRITPTTARRIFLLLTRSHFSDPAHYGTVKEKLKNYVYSDDPAKCTLFIDLDYEYDATKLDRRPAIFVGTDDFSYNQIVTNNSSGNTADNSGENFNVNGKTRIIIRHIAASPDDALQLGEQTHDFFNGIRKLIQQHIRPKQYLVDSQQTSKPFERAGQQADQQFISDVTIALQFDDAWTTLVESHRVKNIRLNFNPQVPVTIPVNS